MVQAEGLPKQFQVLIGQFGWTFDKTLGGKPTNHWIVVPRVEDCRLKRSLQNPIQEDLELTWLSCPNSFKLEGKEKHHYSFDNFAKRKLYNKKDLYIDR